MRPVTLDKIASVTLNCNLRREARLDDQYPCREGDVIAVRVLTSKSQYNSLELISGRMSTIKPGDIIAGALGHRNAVQGYAGVIPTSLKTGDQINLLNLGGVLGTCTSYSPMVGQPHVCEVIGNVMAFPDLNSRRGVPANIAADLSLPSTQLRDLPPIIAVVGTSMNSGKTEACLTVIQQLTHRGLKVSAAKTTGVSLRRDILGMQDAGASEVVIFTDLGVVTTQASNAPTLTKQMIHRLAQARPDVIVLELGDGLIGDYGVGAILDDPEIAPHLRCVILAAADPVGALGGANLVRDRHQLPLALITGPATDNLAGVSAIERETKVRSINARHDPQDLTDHLLHTISLAHA
ncbi:MAG: molybdopterin-guanine dinucleotide biosynthesis protein MobB [Chthonomonas sp.]|nr:molybdopterin-guanine dinucleotide biosynthesis protein MobB [Chthonomonas sp.]